MIFVTQKPAGTVHPFLGTDARSKEQEERSLEQIGRSHPPSPRCWEPMGRSLEILNPSKEQTDHSLERTSRSHERTGCPQSKTHNPKSEIRNLPLPRASDADLYTFFYFRAVQLLAPGGMLAFISSNKWFRAAYGEKLRGFMASQTAIRSITDFGELPVFSAATFPMIFVAQKIVVSPSRRSGSGYSVQRDAETTIAKKQGYFLPHWSLDGAIYHVVFRLRDSLPREVLERFEEEKRQLQRQAVGDRLSKEEARRLNYLVSDRVEQYLDVGHGECLMKNPRIAAVVSRVLNACFSTGQGDSGREAHRCSAPGGA